MCFRDVSACNYNYVQCLLLVFRHTATPMFAHLSMGTMIQIHLKVLSKSQAPEQA